MTNVPVFLTFVITEVATLIQTKILQILSVFAQFIRVHLCDACCEPVLLHELESMTS